MFIANVRYFVWDILFLARGEDYSQFGEQKLIEKYLGGLERGTYVDLGCNQPIKCSNTYWLYRRGWRGIVVDANPDFAWLWRIFRPNDLFLTRAVVVSQKPETDFFKFDSRKSLVSTTDSQQAMEWAKRTRAKFKTTSVATTRVLEVIEKAMGPEKTEVTLLSLDLEGIDGEILEDFLSQAEMLPAFILMEDHSNVPELKGFRYLASAGPSHLFKRT